MSNTITVKEWTDALRSGEYKRGKGRLRRYGRKQDTFCCLGVLCDLINPDNWEYDHVQEIYRYINKGIGNAYVQPGNVEIPESLHIDTLVDLNDEGKSFKTIANHIERYTEPTDVITF